MSETGWVVAPQPCDLTCAFLCMQEGGKDPDFVSTGVVNVAGIDLLASEAAEYGSKADPEGEH